LTFAAPCTATSPLARDESPQVARTLWGEPAGNYLKLTRNAVTYFQQTHVGPNGAFLDVDGVVGPDTWWALRNPSGAAQKSGLDPDIPRGLTPLRTRLLEIALAEHAKGVKEIPDGAIWSPEIAKYGGSKGDRGAAGSGRRVTGRRQGRTRLASRAAHVDLLGPLLSAKAWTIAKAAAKSQFPEMRS
jgi:hypothetical protein